MKNFILPLIAVLALLTGCASGDTKPETLSNSTSGNYAGNVGVADTTPAPTKVTVAPDARIDASSFLEALVESGCEIDKAEYKEVIRGGGIAVTCIKKKDLLSTEGLDDL